MRKLDKVLELCARAVIRHLNGDMKTFYSYRDKAIEYYEKQKFEESCIYQVRHLIPEKTKRKLYELVS